MRDLINPKIKRKQTKKIKITQHENFLPVAKINESKTLNNAAVWIKPHKKGKNKNPDRKKETLKLINNFDPNDRTYIVLLVSFRFDESSKGRYRFLEDCQQCN